MIAVNKSGLHNKPSEVWRHLSLLLLKVLRSDFNCLHQIKKRCSPIQKIRKFAIIILKHLTLELLLQINFTRILFIGIIRVNIPKIKLICYPQCPLYIFLKFSSIFQKNWFFKRNSLWFNGGREKLTLNFSWECSNFKGIL